MYTAQNLQARSFWTKKIREIRTKKNPTSGAQNLIDEHDAMHVSLLDWNAKAQEGEKRIILAEIFFANLNLILY